MGALLSFGPRLASTLAIVHLSGVDLVQAFMNFVFNPAAMGNQQSGAGRGGERGGDKNKEKEKKRYEPPVPTRVGKKRKQAKV